MNLETSLILTLDITIEYTVTGGSPGRFDRLGCPIEPPVPPDVEIVSVHAGSCKLPRCLWEDEIDGWTEAALLKWEDERCGRMTT